ncbi:MAG TPA: hypothetical protein ENJ02_10510 [Chloroflexi bacterium]|nr:hypothetical protein [Chloroflexota bacterium]
MRQDTSQSRRLRNQSRIQREGYAGVATTVLSLVVVALLLTVTFAAEWLRAPEITAAATQALISPNGDQDRDATTLSYTLSEEATVRIEVLDANGQVVRTLVADETQPAGQGFVTWDGTDDSGRRVADGLYRLQITAAGVARSVSRSVLVEVDTTPPTLQLVNLPNGMRMRQPVLEIQGITEPGASVWISGNPAEISVDPDGRFQAQVRLQDGENSFELRAVDEAGNTARLTRRVELVTTPPDILVTDPPDQSWFSSPIVTVRGEAPPDTTLTVNGQPVAVAPDGSFSYDLLLDEGENVIRITATDDVGNLTTVERYVTIKTQPPALSINLTEGERSNTPVIQLSGSTEPGAAVLVNRRVVPVGPKGDFTVALNLNQGDNLLEVTARDQAGNTTTLTRRVTYALPAAPNPLQRVARNLAEVPAGMLGTGLGIVLLGMVIWMLRRQQPVVLTLSAEERDLTPTIPRGLERLTITLELNRPASITVQVLDEGGRRQTTLIRNRRRSARRHRFFWDGYSAAGKPVAPGEYTVQASARALPSQVVSAVQVRVRPAITVRAETAEAATQNTTDQSATPNR